MAGCTHRGRQLQLGSLPVALLKELAGHQLCHLSDRNVTSCHFDLVVNSVGELQKSKTKDRRCTSKYCISGTFLGFCSTLRDMSHGFVTAPRSHAVIIMDLSGNMEIHVISDPKTLL